MQRVARGEATAIELRETLTELAVADVLGRRKDGSTMPAGSVTASLDEAIRNTTDAAKVRGLGTVRAFLRNVHNNLRAMFGTVAALKKARRNGSTAEFDALVNKLFGKDWQAATEWANSQEREKTSDEASSSDATRISENEIDLSDPVAAAGEAALQAAYSLTPFKPKAFITRYLNKKIDHWEKTGETGREEISLGPTPPVLRVAGAEALPVVAPPSLLSKVTRDVHAVPIEALRGLPEALADPVAVFQSRTRPDSIVVLTEFMEGKNPIIAAITLEKQTGRGMLVNEVASYYGKNARAVEQMFGETVLYQNKQKSLTLARRAGLQLPGRGTPARGHKIIPGPEDVVKWMEQQAKTTSGAQGAAAQDKDSGAAFSLSHSKDLETAQSLFGKPEQVLHDSTRSDGLIVLNADSMVERSAEMKAARSIPEGQAIHKRLQPLAAKARNAALEWLLQQPITEADKLIVLTAGGPGSGKSRSLSGMSGSQLVYDTNLGNADAAAALIDRIVATGRKVQIRFVDRDFAAAVRGNIERAVDEKRLSIATAIAKGHFDARHSMLELIERYAHAEVEFDTRRNTSEGLRTMTPEEFEARPKPTIDQLTQQAYDIANELEQQPGTSAEALAIFRGAGGLEKGGAEEGRRGSGAVQPTPGGSQAPGDQPGRTAEGEGSDLGSGAAGGAGAPGSEFTDRMPQSRPTPEPPHEPDPPVPTPPPRRAPISAEIDVRMPSPELIAAVDRVARLQDLAHDDGGMPRATVLPQHADVEGSSYDGRVREVRLDTTTNLPHYEAAHELAHWIDHADANNPAWRGSEVSPQLNQWREAILQSARGRELQAARRANPDDELLAYVCRWRELWARSYAQWLAQRTRDPALTRELDRLRNSPDSRHFQWTDEDFSPISEAIEAALRARGWL